MVQEEEEEEEEEQEQMEQRKHHQQQPDSPPISAPQPPIPLLKRGLGEKRRRPLDPLHSQQDSLAQPPPPQRARPDLWYWVDTTNHNINNNNQINGNNPSASSDIPPAATRENLYDQLVPLFFPTGPLASEHFSQTRTSAIHSDHYILIWQWVAHPISPYDPAPPLWPTYRSSSSSTTTTVPTTDGESLQPEHLQYGHNLPFQLPVGEPGSAEFNLAGYLERRMIRPWTEGLERPVSGGSFVYAGGGFEFAFVVVDRAEQGQVVRAFEEYPELMKRFSDSRGGG
ncbi:MAG: hypothetical protein M1831_002483 [Alyxoria varia]|nr:MAG: hypothetical protein M1831_002483 [Alyxoria varia]